MLRQRLLCTPIDCYACITPFLRPSQRQVRLEEQRRQQLAEQERQVSPRSAQRVAVGPLLVRAR